MSIMWSVTMEASMSPIFLPSYFVFAAPHLVGVGADDDGAGGLEVARAARQVLHALGRFDDDEPLRLPVGSRRGDAARLENRLELLGFDLPVLILAACVPPFGNLQKIHGRIV